jgi:2-aminoadipate transaminase
VEVETVIRDDAGPATGTLGTNPALLYLCPILHNPMGTDIQADRQTEIADWARRTGSVLLSDEVFRDLHPGSNAPASFLANPGPERAIVLGSLSKSFISGLRVGWLVTSEERVRALTRIKKAMDLGCPPLMQGIAEAFLTDPEGYTAHRKRVRAHYRTLRDATLAALDRHMPRTVHWTKPEGGFQLWVSLGEGYSSVEMFMRAIDKGVAFLPGPLQDPDGRFLSSFRLCYGSLSCEEIEEGIKRLGEAVKEYVTQSPGEAVLAGLGDF